MRYLWAPLPSAFPVSTALSRIYLGATAARPDPAPGLRAPAHTLRRRARPRRPQPRRSSGWGGLGGGIPYDACATGGASGSQWDPVTCTCTVSQSRCAPPAALAGSGQAPRHPSRISSLHSPLYDGTPRPHETEPTGAAWLVRMHRAQHPVSRMRNIQTPPSTCASEIAQYAPQVGRAPWQVNNGMGPGLGSRPGEAADSGDPPAGGPAARAQRSP